MRAIIGLLVTLAVRCTRFLLASCISTAFIIGEITTNRLTTWSNCWVNNAAELQTALCCSELVELLQTKLLRCKIGGYLSIEILRVCVLAGAAITHNDWK